MELRLLGPVELIVEGQAVPVGGPVPRAVLAVLALNAGRTVSVERLRAAVWPSPPASVTAQLHNHVSALRKRLAAGPSAIVRNADGYALQVDPGVVDALVFESLVTDVPAADAGPARWTPREATLRIKTLTEALAMWRGTPLAGLPDTGFVAAEADRLGEIRLRAVQELCDAELAAGNHGELIGRLRSLIAEHPLRETFRAQLMLALYRAGRSAEALGEFRAARAVAREELGGEPGAGLRALHRRMLAADPELDWVPEDAAVDAGGAAGAARDGDSARRGGGTSDGAASTRSGSASAAGAAARSGSQPRPTSPSQPQSQLQPQPQPPSQEPAPSRAAIPEQLPYGIGRFSGREAELELLDRVAAGADPGSGQAAAPIVVVSGLGGVGKSALAVHWARQCRESFPDGRLFVDLRGFSAGEPTRPAEVLPRFLRALGVPPDRIPADPDEASALYRSALAGSRTLVLLDNAADADQVRPLLPAAPGCLAVVTSRHRLAGLVAVDGAYAVELDALTDAEAVMVLTDVLGADRAAAEADAVRDLAASCSRIPLALRIAAARLAARPQQGIAEFTASLDAGDRLSALEVDGDSRASIRHSLDLSYSALEPPAARLLGLFGLLPPVDLGGPALAALAGMPGAAAERTVAALASVHLLTEPVLGRHGMHDLVRLYAREQAAAGTDPQDGRSAVEGLLDWYAAAAMDGNGILAQHRVGAPARDLARPPAEPHVFESEAAVLEWFDAEVEVLRALVSHAAACGLPRPLWQLVDGMVTYFMRRHRPAELVELGLLGFQAAVEVGRPDAAASLANNLGIGYSLLRRPDDAVTWYQRSLTLRAAGGGSPEAAAVTQVNLGGLLTEARRFTEGEHHLREALRLSVAAGNRISEAGALSNLGYLLFRVGDSEAAETVYAQAIPLMRELGLWAAVCGGLGNLGSGLLNAGRPEEALTALREAAELSEELGMRLNVARNQLDIGDAHRALGDLDQAVVHWTEAAEVFDAIGSPEAARARRRLAAPDTPWRTLPDG